MGNVGLELEDLVKLSCFLLLCCLAAHSTFADETNLTLTVDGITYSNVTFGTVSPASVSIHHSTGLATIPLAKLPAELQQRFGYDPQRAAQYRQAEQVQRQKLAVQEAAVRQAKRTAQAAEDIAKLNAEICAGSPSFSAEIVQVFTEGLLVRIVAGELKKGDGWASSFTGDPLPERVLIGHPKHDKLAEGNYVQCRAYRDGVFRYTTVLGASRSVERWVYCGELSNELKRSLGIPLSK